MYDPIPQVVTDTTISSALKVLQALIDFGKKYTGGKGNIIIDGLPVSRLQKDYSISDQEIEEGSILLHNKLLAQRGTQDSPNGIFKTLKLTESGRDLSLEDIKSLLILPNAQSRGN